MMKIKFPVYEPCLSYQEKKYVNQCLDSGWISSRGAFIGKFEDRFANFIGAKFATSVCNGTVAIHLALEALKIGPGDEVIVPTFTYIASVNPIIQVGATPVYVDSLELTWQIDPEDVLRKITKKTKAVMVVHMYGLSADMDRLCKICREHKIYLIEDCAEAFGAYYKNRHVGTFGDLATFSFFGNKTITTGEGGMVVCQDANIARCMRHKKNQGVSADREYWHDVLAYNYRMTNICAAIGLAQLEKINFILQRKRWIANEYKNKLVGLPLTMHEEQPNTVHSFWMNSIRLNDPTLREGLRCYLKKHGVETRRAFNPVHKMPHCFSPEIFSTADLLSSSILNIPSYPALNEEHIDYIATLIKSYFGSQ